MAKSVLPPQQNPNPQQVQIQSVRWDYPYPPPDIWNMYTPEMQNVIVEAWQSEMKHRRELEIIEAKAKASIALAEAKEINAESFERYTIVALAAIILLSFIGLGIYLVIMGKSVEGLIALIAPIAIMLGRYWNTKNGKK